MYVSATGSTGGKKASVYFPKNKYAISVGATRAIPTANVYDTTGIPSYVYGMIPFSGAAADKDVVCGWATMTWYVKFISL